MERNLQAKKCKNSVSQIPLHKFMVPEDSYYTGTGTCRTRKENLSNILREKNAEPNSWYSVLDEAAYKKKHNHTCCNPNENQDHYNTRMKQARGKAPSFKVHDIVAIKIDKVDKTSPLHPNVLIGKVLHVENNYTKVVTSHGIISTSISTNYLNKCTATNNVFGYSKEISFSSACKTSHE